MANLTRTKLGVDFKSPSQYRLRELLNYDPATGVMRWTKMRKGVPHDDMVAGCSTSDGYLKISVDGTQYKAHQVIWCWMTGEWPSFVDHRDVDGMNNRWDNLRRSTVAQNNQNMKSKKPAGSPSKLKGAYFDKRRKVWHSRIMVDRKLMMLGDFDSAEAAHTAYADAARKLHGDFARVG